MSPVVQYFGSGCGQAGNLQGIKRSIETYELLDQVCTCKKFKYMCGDGRKSPVSTIAQKKRILRVMVESPLGEWTEISLWGFRLCQHKWTLKIFCLNTCWECMDLTGVSDLSGGGSFVCTLALLGGAKWGSLSEIRKGVWCWNSQTWLPTQ